MKFDNSFVKCILKFINSNENLNKIFNHHKQKYTIEELLTALIYKLKKGISYENTTDVFKNIKGANLHYFHKKIIKYKLFEQFFDNHAAKTGDFIVDDVDTLIKTVNI
jgi:hypothetical protein